MPDHENPPEAPTDPATSGLPPLVTLGDPQLAKPSLAVDPALISGADFQARLRTLARAMEAYEGIGIAAPQVGWCERFFLLLRVVDEGESGRREELAAWINPEIVEASAEQCWAWEGCLSVPGLRGWIRRPAAVAVRGFDARGEARSAELRGWDARVFQHEYDHLEGWLFPYRAADPRHVVLTEQLEHREHWPGDWPAPGARETPQGEVWLEPGSP